MYIGLLRRDSSHCVVEFPHDITVHAEQTASNAIPVPTCCKNAYPYIPFLKNQTAIALLKTKPPNRLLVPVDLIKRRGALGQSYACPSSHPHGQARGTPRLILTLSQLLSTSSRARSFEARRDQSKSPRTGSPSLSSRIFARCQQLLQRHNASLAWPSSVRCCADCREIPCTKCAN